MTTPPTPTPHPHPPAADDITAREEITARLEALTDEVETLRASHHGLPSTADVGVQSGAPHNLGGGEPPTPLYADLDSWVRFFTAVYTRPVGGVESLGQPDDGQPRRASSTLNLKVHSAGFWGFQATLH
jgi:hypothetical protein